MIRIVVTGWHAENYINKCLTSIEKQTFQHWTCCVVLDPSSDKTYENAKKHESGKIKIIKNETRNYAIKNIVTSINTINPNDEDIIVLIDADDWLAHNYSLQIVNNQYNEQSNLLLTHGSWEAYPNKNAITNNGAYTKQDFMNGIRRVSLGSWRGSHLKTFKYKIYKRINQNRDFKDINGNWLKSSYDLSIMLPILEMAGFDRIKFIPHVIYVYNRETQWNDDKVDPAMQDNCTNYLMALSPYSKVENV